MDFILVLVVAAVVFSICFLADKGFSRAFRNTPQHKSGRSVRVNKRYASVGLILIVLAVAAIFSGLADGWLLVAGGGLLAVIGIGLVVYYLSFGVYYDDEQLVVSTFGKRSRAYYYKDIRGQQLYNSYGNTVVELHMSDGRSIQLHSAMEGMYPFMDGAFERWLIQTGKDPDECEFYDPENSCWFPNMED